MSKINVTQTIRTLIVNSPNGMTPKDVYDKLRQQAIPVEYADVLSACSHLRKRGDIGVLKKGKQGSIPTIYGKPPAPAANGEEL